MQPPKLAVLFVISLLFFSCDQSSDPVKPPAIRPIENAATSQEENTEPAQTEEKFECVVEDGKYSSVVEYVNSQTGHRAVYSLDVRVKDCNVDIIYWPSGGWSDSDHITPGELSSEGRATVYGEGGKVYKILLEM